MRLYHCDNSRSFRALWALEEVGAAYELISLSFPPRETSPDYLGINPLGTVPFLVDGETRMTESAAICQYLADRHSSARLNIASDAPRYGDYLNALHYGEATLTAPQAIYLRYALFEPEERRSKQVSEDYRVWFHARLSWLDVMLARGRFVAGDDFTIADISTGYALMLARHFGLDDGISDRQAEYFQELIARPAWGRAYARQAPV